MIRRILAFVEPFIIALLGTVLLASVFPARGVWATVADRTADAGIVLLFFLHGGKLSREAILTGMRNWRLHLATLGVTFLLFPLLGLAFRLLPFVPATFAAGLLFLTLLPSTVQSSIAFTAIARGNVAAAVCAASFSNLFGIIATPALVALLMGGTTGGVSWASVQRILLQLLLPFVLGHLLRPWIGGFVVRNKQWLGRVDRGSILLVVYAAFGAAVKEGLWQRIAPSGLALLTVLCLILLGIVLWITTLLGRAMGLSREDAVVLLFCGSKKSLASGVPMAGVLFPAAQVGIVLLPVMLFHQLQLIACALIAPRLAARAYAVATPD
ncbi:MULTISPECIES: bile acid:sodium symporter family protein [Sphingomonadales]|uniref:Sodium Bile acid symporter family protein n=1 Tax=Edaphosphingomonas haloaromaticamans TaxID=653954 RepID=A0A1S1HDW8_9SPHN|nr:bile acid:sodium symporter family protein [Sphingomonas haloaromaticamans]OHT18690.1 Sodium Bile acid symporter family protein [Sphingomonas haloaromaticamans]